MRLAGSAREMARQTTVAGARKRRSWPQEAERPEAAWPAARAKVRAAPWRAGCARRLVGSAQAEARAGPDEEAERARAECPEGACGRAHRRAAAEGDLVAVARLLLALTAERLATARNCGPHTMREIVDWAQGCGVTIKPVLQPGGSLSQMWAELIANASAGALTSAEIAGALQRSIRRKSVRIPIAFQVILVKILLSSFE